LANTAVRARDLDEAAALQAKERAEEALRDRKADIDYATAQAELAESIAKLRAIQKLRERTRRK
ncbi:MAG: ATP synthase delta/epsilon chain alpha-helix domain-containing protein, partial [Sulfuricaulis sp.]|nr:ATP synthase delta/epsilon chain alpha-helix domain-containing protein [Sulfuricaulis sp.]